MPPRKVRKDLKAAHIQHHCYICATTFSSARRVITHLQNLDGVIIDPRKLGIRRPSSNRFRFEVDHNKHYDSMLWLSFMLVSLSQEH